MERNEEYDNFMDCVELALSELPAEPEYTHVMSPGIYSRTMLLKAGLCAVSKIHKTEHIFTLTYGVMLVGAEGEGFQEVHAPYMQITKPGTRRMGIAVTDCYWTTYHAVKYQLTNDEWRLLSEEEKKQILDEIEEDIIEKHENVLLLQNNKEIE